MLRAARIGIAVTEGEGSAVDALMAADIYVRNALDGLDLLLNPKRCKATLRYYVLAEKLSKNLILPIKRL